MRKIELKSEPEQIESYIEYLRNKFPQYEININNANDFSVMLTETENCRQCCGLNFCKNDNPGFQTVFEEGRFVLTRCRYKKEEQMKNSKHSLIKTLYLPQSILEANLADFHTNTESRRKIYSQIVSFVRDFSAKENKKGLYLHGGFSIGKTFTLACIANELSKNEISCLLIYFPDLVVDLKNAIGTPRFEALVNMLKSVEVLMLDDLGSENITPWLRDEILGPIFNYRSLEHKPVFVSSNIKPNEIKNHFAIDKSPASEMKAERLVSRMNALMVSVNMEDTEKYER